jgi:CheY-like chemotaxis protein
MMFRSRAEAEGLELIIERDEALPNHILADEEKLRQVFVNLMGNALKFTETGGVAVRVRSEPEGDGTVLRLVCEVEDSGPGIPEKDLDSIFDSFSQGDAGARVGGTGLGLAISRRFVEMMGGRLTVESTLGRGSCFRFEVPVSRAEGPATTEKSEPRRVKRVVPGEGPFRILVVDDKRDNRELLRALLDPIGFHVREAANGEEALSAFADWSPHAVLMDMRMPVMDGYEATRRIKATEAGRDTPVIAVTASAFKDAKEEILATGVSAYLRKPFQPEELYEALRECLGLHYVYAEEPVRDAPRPGRVVLTPESLAALPRDKVAAMGRAVEQGDMGRLRELIDGVETLDPAAAAGLRALAEAYDYEALGRLFAMMNEERREGK